MSEDVKDLKKQVLDAPSSELTESSKSIVGDLDLNRSEEAKQDNHNLKREVKSEFKLCIPVIVKSLLFLAASSLVVFIVLCCYYLYAHVIGDKAETEKVILGFASHVGTFVFGTLGTVVFKNKSKK